MSAEKDRMRLSIMVVEEARKQIGHAVYKKQALLKEAPQQVSCTTFTAYLYGLVGIGLPLRQQNETGVSVNLASMTMGDLVFVFGATTRYGSPGHVGIATGEGTVIHADPQAGTVVEGPLDDFIGDGTRTKVRRLL